MNSGVASDSLLLQRFEKHKKRSIQLRTEPILQRIGRLRKLEKWLHANRQRVGSAMYADFQKPALEVDTSEVYPVLTELRHTLKHLEEWSRPRKVDATLAYIGTRSEIRYEPKGVCLIIAPWNFPFNLCAGPLVSCLAAGNTAIIKPSELTPNTSRVIKAMANEIFEEDVVWVEEGGVEVSQGLLSLPFDHIFFTGSPTVGRLVMEAAAKNLSSITLELGGKSPAVVESSANLKDAARRIAFGKFLNNGQTCIAPDYILVETKVKEKFMTLLKEEVLLIFGNGKSIDEQSTSYSRIVNARNFSRVQNLVSDALEGGAVVERLGGFNEKTNFLAPVILTNVFHESKILNEEIFGPVLPILDFSTEDEVLFQINKRPKPLALYIFSDSKRFREAILQGTSSGGVCINECVLQFTHPNLPFGGVNNSGIGKSHGQYGFVAFSNEKPVLRQKSGWAAPYLLHPPYTKGMKRVVDILIKWF